MRIFLIITRINKRPTVAGLQ